MKLPSTLAAMAITLFVCGTAWAQAAPAQAQPTPEQMKQVMQTAMASVIAMIRPMTEATIDAQLVMAEKPDTAERVASFKKNLFDALVKKGFKTDEALQIVISTGIPSAAQVGK